MIVIGSNKKYEINLDDWFTKKQEKFNSNLTCFIANIANDYNRNFKIKTTESIIEGNDYELNKIERYGMCYSTTIKNILKISKIKVLKVIGMQRFEEDNSGIVLLQQNENFYAVKADVSHFLDKDEPLTINDALYFNTLEEVTSGYIRREYGIKTSEEDNEKDKKVGVRFYLNCSYLSPLNEEKDGAAIYPSDLSDEEIIKIVTDGLERGEIEAEFDEEFDPDW